MRSIVVGLDLGQASDYSALVAVERVFVLPRMVSLNAWNRQPALYQGDLREERWIVAAQRWELGTPYTAVLDDVVAMMRGPLADGLLVVDYAGVGRPVLDSLREQWNRARYGCTLPHGLTVTGGGEASGWSVPKVDLYGNVSLLLQQGRLRIAQGLPLGAVLEKELAGFRLKIGPSGRERIEYDRGGQGGHGDLVSAAAMAVYVDNRISRPQVVEDPTIEGTNHV